MKQSRFALMGMSVLAAVLSGCSSQPKRAGNEVLNDINDVLIKSATERKASVDAMDKSLMPDLGARSSPVVPPAELTSDPRFDLSVVNAPATQVFMALVSGTRYSMLVAPDVTGNITLNLKDVNVSEALDTIRELYGYEYRMQGRRIFIEPNTLRSKVFHINYLSSRRQGSSDLRVSGSSIASSAASSASSNGATTPQATTSAVPAGAGSPTAARGSDTSRVTMSTDSDFWGDLQRTLATIIGTEEGRSVVLNPSSGVVVVRGFPSELRNIEKYLKATQLIAERQVMLEAKIIDVSLSEDYQAGINWGAFGSGKVNAALGVMGSNATLTTSVRDTGFTQPITVGSTAVLPGEWGAAAVAASGKGLVGLALQTANFSALVNFLETQGQVSVLSSPRIATLNNQKAVLKVGTDELYVTNVTTQTTTTTTGSVATPSLTLQPYFSGISLDVTPQIDDEGNIILHVHPAISTVQEKEKVIDLGTLGTYKLPLAASSINETDSIVRAQDGNIVAIGGLMRQEQSGDRSGLPGASNLPFLGQRGNVFKKRELVILIKPTIIKDDRNWTQDLKNVQERLEAYASPAASSLEPR